MPLEDVSSQDYADYRKWWEKENSFQNKLLRSLKPGHLVLFGILIFIGLRLWQSEGTNKNVIMMIIGGIIALVIILSMKQTGKLNPIPENVAWQISQRELDRKVANNQVPTGTIFTPTNISKLIHLQTGVSEMIPFRWKLLFVQKTPNNLEKQIIFYLHPFNGYCIGICRGNENDVNSSDIKIVYPDMYVQKQPEEKEEK